MAASYAILAARTKMTYPADCRARSATAEAPEGHLRSTPATGKHEVRRQSGCVRAIQVKSLKPLQLLHHRVSVFHLTTILTTV
jgi:hypothetical protein